LQELNATAAGLTDSEAENRQKTYGLNSIQTTKHQTTFLLFLSQFKSPITIILLLASLLSYALRDSTDAIIIIIIVFLSSMLGFWQEKAAGNAIARLLAMVRIKATVIRNNQSRDIPLEDIVPGDVILLNAGDVIPADCLLMESNELFIDEATFTGETFPVEKLPGILPEDTVLAKRTNSLFMGSHVISGTAKVLAVKTGTATEFGNISQSLKTNIPETDFARGIRKFGYLLMQITFIMVILIFTTNVMLHKPVLDSLLFTLAIAVGLTPQLLPAIITVNMASGARRMAAKQVIVKRLSSIENFGSMDTLCSDKTGTLTAGIVKVHEGADCYGQQNNAVLALAKINSTLQQGFRNPIDEAIAALDLPDFHQATRLDEIPYDFIRKRLTLLVQATDQPPMLITKGALNQVTAVCNRALNASGQVVPIEGLSAQIQQTYESLSAKGYRTLGVAYKDWKNNTVIHKEDEKEMIFAGFVSLFDPPKPGIGDTLNELRSLGIRLKVITEIMPSSLKI
jgi:Mg2+-importing ATPase